jgi:hypothetical protein
MVSSTSNTERSSIQPLIKKVIQTSELTRKEHLILSSRLLATMELSVAERNQINRIFDYIRMGRVRLLD